ncbi:TonB-dependent receptor [Nitrobacter sp.]|uniref:TonB-dependent receptor n=1 Tax=Nitrobacter sp. TaxID=29420 RepID=UPI0029CAC1A5|nr:TonB-dependent receptor [Nitrobacter sp.]
MALKSSLLANVGIGSGGSAQAQQTARTVQFSIPAQPLSSAVDAFSRVTGWQVGYSSDIARSTTTRAVSGAMTPAQALQTMVAGTGVTVSITGPASAALVSSAANAGSGGANVAGAISLDTIDVQGAGNPNSTMTPMPAYAGGQVATGGQVGFFGNRSFMDTPFNQTNYTAKLIQDQQARTLADVLENDPSVRPMNQSSAGYSDLMIRGFMVGGNDIGLNGLYGLVPSGLVSTDFVERVEVLKGPSALLNGMPPGGSIGGSVNLVPKRAGSEPVTQITTRYVSRGQLGAHVDIARRFGPDDACGLRFNGSYANGETAIDDNKNRLGLAALGLDCRTDRVRVAADLNYQDMRTNGATPYIFIAPGLPVPKAPKASKPFWPNWWLSGGKAFTGVINGEVDLLPDLTVYASIGVLRQKAYGVTGTPFMTDANGDYTAFVVRDTADYVNNVVGQAGIRGTFDTGPINHAFNVNISGLDKTFGSGENPGTDFSSNIYTPSFIPRQSIPHPIANKANSTRLSSVGIGDTISVFDKRIQLTVGVRRQQIVSDNFDTTTGALTSSYEKAVWSPAYALVIKPLENISLYANYIEGLQQGTTVSTRYANAGQVFPPYQSKQYEGGVKVDWGRVTATVSAFQIMQPRAIATPGTPLPTLNVDGEQRNRGVEINAFGEVAQGLRVLGGVMFIDGRQVKTANAINDGKKAIGVPDMQVNLGAEWDTPFIAGLTLSGRVIYTGAQYIIADNTQSIPDWTRVDLGARYTFTGPQNKPVTVRFDVLNVANANEWASVYLGGAITTGAPRTFLLSTAFNF